ncbi:TadE family type IV pilus minor pilin [Rothia uropygialis]|uniref:TadE family type IV pilus minor pilin n=1 Tax=Kocuria sp. 36 TaxID=1415402 RepID=UPI00237A0ECA|nr:TadE family type IV pilus minor pilin [Kocuria sp. 36]
MEKGRKDAESCSPLHSAVGRRRKNVSGSCPRAGVSLNQDGESGTITAEFAVVMPVVIILVAFVLGAGAVGARAIKVEEAARMSARSAARGESWEETSHVARSIAGDDARIDIKRSGQDIDISVSARAPGILGTWGNLVLASHAHAQRETGTES